MLWLCFVFICDLVISTGLVFSCEAFTHNFWGPYTGTGKVLWLPKYHWNNLKYIGKIGHPNYTSTWKNVDQMLRNFRITVTCKIDIYICQDYPFLYYIFQRKHKLVFTFYVTAPHWHGIGSRNPSSCKADIYQFDIVHIMAADDQEIWEARASATTIFVLLNWINSVPTH